MTEQYACQSYYDDDGILRDCTCGNIPHNCEQNIESNMAPAHCSVCKKLLNTPETEWELPEPDLVTDDRSIGKFAQGKKEWYSKQTLILLLFSRPTYWKERVRKEVEGMKVDCRHEEGHDKYREHCAMYGGTCKHQGRNQALDTLVDNFKNL